MPIALTCPCGRALHIKDEFAGRKVRCPACKSILAVPAAPKETDPDDLVLEVLRADEPDEESSPPRRVRPSAIQAEPPEVLPAGPRRPTEEGISSIRRRHDEERPIKARARPRRHDVRRAPRVAFERGWFGSMNAGVAGGILMILIAVIWFVAGLAGGIIFFYPPILLVIGLIAIGKGLMGGGD